MKYWITYFFIFAFLAFGYYLYLLNRQTYPIDYGISFNKQYATELGLDWREVYETMMKELQPRYVRISAPWDEVEAVKGELNFEDVDWQMNMAAAHGARVILAIGQKAPRWPECHIPKWVNYEEPKAVAYLQRYVYQTVHHFRSHQALEMWQVENEPFIRFKFGECENYHKDAIYKEIQTVKGLDPLKPIIVTDSGEMGLWWGAVRAGDFFGTTMYRVVRSPRGSIFTYDWVPPVAYRIKAALTGVDFNRFFVSELQAEPWFDGSDPTDTPVDVQEETMNPMRLQKHLDYVQHIGASRAYLWGVEWWYFMREAHGDSRYWDMVKEVL